MYLILALLSYPPLQNYLLYPLYRPHPSPMSYWHASNAEWQYQWPHAATLTLSTVHPNASSSAHSTVGSTPHQPMVLACPQTSILTLYDPAAMHAQMAVRTPSTAPKSDSNRLANTE